MDMKIIRQGAFCSSNGDLTCESVTSKIASNFDISGLTPRGRARLFVRLCRARLRYELMSPDQGNPSVAARLIGDLQQSIKRIADFSRLVRDDGTLGGADVRNTPIRNWYSGKL